MLFSVHTMAWSGEHRAFVVEDVHSKWRFTDDAACLSHPLRAWSTFPIKKQYTIGR
jgi:hypothetical protein